MAKDIEFEDVKIEINNQTRTFRVSRKLLNVTLYKFSKETNFYQTHPNYQF